MSDKWGDERSDEHMVVRNVGMRHGVYAVARLQTLLRSSSCNLTFLIVPFTTGDLGKRAVWKDPLMSGASEKTFCCLRFVFIAMIIFFSVITDPRSLFWLPVLAVPKVGRSSEEGERNGSEIFKESLK